MRAKSRSRAALEQAPAENAEPTSTTTSVDRVVPADEIEQLQRQVYELVKTRVLDSIGAGANWTVTFRTSADTDTFYSDTMADMIAWDVATQLLPPTVPNRPRLVA